MASNEHYDVWSDVVELLEDLPLDDQPTDALPGTPEKEAVFQSRIRRRRNIFHPLDAALPDNVGFEPVPGFRDGEFFRGMLLSQERDGSVAVVPGQKRRPKLKKYSDGPGMEERRKRAKARAADPERKRKDAARARAARAFQKRKRVEAQNAAECEVRVSLFG
jgi:hypothetical protein